MDKHSANCYHLAIKYLLRIWVLEKFVFLWLNLQEWRRLSDLDHSAKLGAIVYEHHFFANESDVRVNSGDADVGNLHVTLDASTYSVLVLRWEHQLAISVLMWLEISVASTQVKDVDNLGRCTLERLQYHVFFLLGQVDAENFEHHELHFVLKRLFAELAFE